MHSSVKSRNERGAEMNRGPSGLNSWRALSFGLLAGATLMYFFDGDSGARRRSLTHDKLSHLKRVSKTRLTKRSRDVNNRIIGFFTELQNMFSYSDEAVDDAILEGRIRAKIGRVLTHPKMVHIECHDGHVQMSGYAIGREVPILYDVIRRVRGVKNITSNNVVPVHDEKQMSTVASTSGKPQATNVEVTRH